NIIPETVELAGTIRYEKPEVQETIHAEIERALSIARALGGDYELLIRRGAPPVINDERVVDLLRAVIGDLLGEESLQPQKKGMGGEDFSLFTALAPGAMFRLGCRIEGDPRTAHHPRFDLDERCLPIGAAVLAEAALRLLRQGGVLIAQPALATSTVEPSGAAMRSPSHRSETT
ncbi:MAG TPA: M20/M25/M40 family metallo-hydrolase, partial [Anaerolineae bacterium]|nr:M20/M25/M40 family metallo-hydrolase [Anaerolineae bacterium]